MTDICFPLPVKVPAYNERMIDDNRHYTKSNLNVCYAAPRSARKSRDWYETQFTVSTSVRCESDGSPKRGYPLKNVPFVVITDDGYKFKCHTTSQNNKQFSAVGDELILGRWLKGRLVAAGLVRPVNDTGEDHDRQSMITKEMLDEYGCNSLLLTKTDCQIHEDARIGWQNLRTSEFLDSGDYMLITGTDFDDGTVNYSTCHFVERERYEQDKNIQIRNGSILITKDGTLGKVAYVQSLSMPATLNAGVFNVEIRNTSIVDERYLFQYLKAPFLMDYVDKKATGGTIKHLNQNILVDFPVVMPKKTEQVSIGNFFQRIDTLITLHQREHIKPILEVKRVKRNE